jgi:hypothetical protein
MGGMVMDNAAAAVVIILPAAINDNDLAPGPRLHVGQCAC